MFNTFFNCTNFKTKWDLCCLLLYVTSKRSALHVTSYALLGWDLSNSKEIESSDLAGEACVSNS